MNSTKEIFKNLIGTWGIKRILGNFGIGEGTAKFTLQQAQQQQKQEQRSPPSSSPEELVLLYREDLEVTYSSPAGVKGQQGLRNTAYKEYLYIYNSETDRITKKFADEDRLFYDLKISFDDKTSSYISASGEHLCDKDLYKASYTFKDREHFSLTYYVNGPQKNYTIETEFNKLCDDS